MNHLQTIASYHEVSVEELSKEELEIGLACSKKVRKHLATQVVGTNGYKYYHNLQVLEQIICTYQDALMRHRIPLLNHHATDRLHLSA